MHAASGAWELPGLPWALSDGTSFWTLKERAEAVVAELESRLARPPADGLGDPVPVTLLAKQVGEMNAAFRALARAHLAVEGLIEFGRSLERERQREAQPPARHQVALRVICPRSGSGD